jgi:hypothetical protein
MKRTMSNKEKAAYTKHCLRMNEIVLMRNNKLKNLTDEQYFSVIARTADKSYEQMENEK